MKDDHPIEIDGSADALRNAGFVIKRENPLMPEATYCLYSLLQDRVLFGYIGMCRKGGIVTLKELTPIQNFKKRKGVLYDWFSQLVRASCEKIIL